MGAHHEGGVRSARRGYRAARVGLGLRELGESDRAREPGRVHGGREAMGGAGGADRDEHRSRACAREQELEAADLIAAAGCSGAVLPLEPQRVYAGRHRERRGALERGGPVAQTTRRQRGAYLSRQPFRIGHYGPLSRGQAMRVSTDYIRHAARAARKCAGDPLGGAPEPPDAEFYRTLAKAFEEIAAGLEQLGKGE